MTKTISARRASQRHDSWTPKRRGKFLDVLARTANVRAAAEAAGKGKCTAYTLRRRDPDFARAWEEALTSAMDELEAVAFERARDGVEKVVVRAGGTPVTIREYSDRLLMFMLSRRRPQAYAALAVDEEDEELTLYRAVEARVAMIEARREGGAE